MNYGLRSRRRLALLDLEREVDMWGSLVNGTGRYDVNI